MPFSPVTTMSRRVWKLLRKPSISSIGPVIAASPAICVATLVQEWSTVISFFT